MDNMKKIENKTMEVEHRAAHVLSRMVRGVEAAVSIGSILRYLDRGPTLRWFGIGRRRSVWGTLGLIGAGMVAGAGLSMLLSPMSGRETREGLARGVRNLGQKGKEVLETAEKEIAELGGGDHHEGQETGGGTGQQRSGAQGGSTGAQGGTGSQSKSEGTPGSMRIGEGTRPGEATPPNGGRGEGGKSHRPS